MEDVHISEKNDAFKGGSGRPLSATHFFAFASAHIINQSIIQAIKQPSSQSVNQPVNHTINQSIKQSNQSFNDVNAKTQICNCILTEHVCLLSSISCFRRICNQTWLHKESCVFGQYCKSNLQAKKLGSSVFCCVTYHSGPM